MAAVPPQPPGEPLTGWERVSRLFGYAFARHDAEHELPPMPEEFREWARDTVVASGLGLLLGGGRKWAEERHAAAPAPPSDAPTKLHAARAIAEANTQRMSRIANAAVKGAAHFGAIAAVFYGVQLVSSVYRGRRDFLDAAHGGLAAGAVFGVSLHRSVRAKVPLARSLVLGAALGSSMGIPLGLAQDKLVTLLPQEHQAARRARWTQLEGMIETGAVEPARVREAKAARGYDVTETLIQQLEASLSSSPTRQQQQAAGQQQQQQQQQAGQRG